MSLMCFARILLNHSTKSETNISAKSQMLQSSFFLNSCTQIGMMGTQKQNIWWDCSQEEGNVSDVHIFLPFKPAGLGHVCPLSQSFLNFPQRLEEDFDFLYSLKSGRPT